MILAEKLRTFRDKNELIMSEDWRLSENCVNSSGNMAQGNLSHLESVKD